MNIQKCLIFFIAYFFFSATLMWLFLHAGSFLKKDFLNRSLPKTVIIFLKHLDLLLSSQKDNDCDHRVRVAIGNGLRADVWREFIRRFGDIRIFEFYAATEGNVGFVNYIGKIGAVGRLNYFHKVRPKAYLCSTGSFTRDIYSFSSTCPVTLIVLWITLSKKLHSSCYSSEVKLLFSTPEVKFVMGRGLDALWQ